MPRSGGRAECVGHLPVSGFAGGELQVRSPFRQVAGAHAVRCDAVEPGDLAGLRAAR